MAGPVTLTEKSKNYYVNSALLSYTLYKHAGIFKNTREVLVKHQPQASASRTSRVSLEISKCLYPGDLMLHKEQVVYFFYKMCCALQALVLIT